MNNQIYFTLSHAVKDFDAWKVVYDKDESRRQGQGIQVTEVLRDQSNPVNVHLIGKAASLDAVTNFVNDPELKEKMDMAGVVSKPELQHFTLAEEDSGAKGDSCMVLSHKVSDYEKWKKAYDEHSEARSAHGVQPEYLLRDLNDANIITLVAKAPNAQAIQNFIGSEDLREKMQEAGVVSQPVVGIYNS